MFISRPNALPVKLCLPLMAQATDGIADSEQGLASGLVQSSGQVGTALILAVVTALVAAGGAAGSGGGDFTQFHPGVNLVTGVAVAGLLLNLVALRTRRA